jgi:digeranylgeranylglycerophospholipid reductase
MTTERVDVIVVGLGPAGASAAAQAALCGCKVFAIDRKREPGRPVQCAEFVPAMIGAETGALAACVRQSIDAMATFVENDAPDVKQHFPGYMLDRAAFDAALVSAATQAGARCTFAAGVRSVGADGRLELADGRTIGAKVVVGADGPRSIVGRAMGQRNLQLVETRQITVPLRQAHQATDIFLSARTPGGYGWLFPKGDVANLGAGVEPAHKGRLKNIVAALHSSLVADGRVGPEILGMTGGPIPVGGMLRPAAMLGETLVLLAGDAAGLANPVTGAGIAAAVHSGRRAGAVAAGHVSGLRAAAADYAEEIESVFKAALDRALRRRAELAAIASTGALPDKAALRRGWIAYPQYWAA